MLPENRPSIDERYMRATQSSHLEVSNERTGDVDLLIASGWIGADNLGALLFRLRTEFDAVNRVELRNAATSLIARTLTLMQLRSLPSTRDALGRYAVRAATLTKFMRDDRGVMKVAGRALDLWLDPMCPACDGRGFNGRPGEPRLMCTQCGGSTHRPLKLDHNDDGQRFGRYLMNAMDSKTQHVAAMLLRFTRTRGR